MSPEPTVDALLNLYHSLTPEQQELFSSQQSSASSAATSPQSSAAMIPDPASPSPNPRATPVTIAGTRAGLLSARGRGTPNVDGKSMAKKRPLNAFMAFRTNYSPQLAGLTQKTKSGLMKDIWSAEPQQHIWALVAKAYTYVRDNHTVHTPLDKFLAVVTTSLPLVPSDTYLAEMGWEITTEVTGEHIAARLGEWNAQDHAAKYPAQTNKSVADLVSLCYQSGLVRPSSRVNRKMQVDTGNIVSMPFAARPSNQAGEARTFDLDRELNDMLSAEASHDFDFNNMAIELPNDYRPSIATVTDEQTHAFENTPFAIHFHPDVHPPILGFDPREVQDDFDPFSFDMCLSDIFDFGASV